MSSICYLCGQPIDAPGASGDHVVPVALVNRPQPKMRGFDYAGKLRTHPECNNRFGPEIYVSRALEMLAFLHSDDGRIKYRLTSAPDIEIHAWDASKLPNFKQRDIEFFKLIDVRTKERTEWSDREFFRDKPRTNPGRDALQVALSVLVKSAAALLIKRKLSRVPAGWQIYAAAYSGASRALDFDQLLGQTEPFGDEVKVWLHQLDDGPDWLAVYRASSVLVFFVFAFGDHDAKTRLKQLFEDTDLHRFHGRSINELLAAGWHKV